VYVVFYRYLPTLFRDRETKGPQDSKGTSLCISLSLSLSLGVSQQEQTTPRIHLIGGPDENEPRADIHFLPIRLIPDSTWTRV